MSNPSTSSNGFYKVPDEEEINQQLDYEAKVSDIGAEVSLAEKF